MDNIIIRECRESDCEDIYRLCKEGMGYEYPLEEIKKKIASLINNSAHKIFVAHDENTGKSVGFIHLNDYDLLYFPHIKNVMGLAVLPQYRRRGIARALMRKAEEYARESGAGGIRLVSGEERKGAHEFYKAVGFTGDKRQLNFRKMF